MVSVRGRTARSLLILLAVVVIGVPLAAIQSSHLCACMHPLESLVGLHPLRRTDAELLARLRYSVPPGSALVDAEKTLLGLGSYEGRQYCRRNAAATAIECRGILSSDWLGYRRHGLEFRLAIESPGRVGDWTLGRYVDRGWN